MPKSARVSTPPDTAVRTRRAYFDCRFGQLHVRTAFPTTGGFDEQVTAFCMHPAGSTSRIFDRFLPLFAAQRSVYAPDLPGCGESDPGPDPSPGTLAFAVADLALDLGLRQIDLVGLQGGAKVALELALQQPGLVRRLVLVGLDAGDVQSALTHPCLWFALGTASAQRAVPRLPPHSKVEPPREYAPDLFDAAPKTLAERFASFLSLP
jgi:pimeloyl-ACP methyl ester carboxylesterase